MIKMKKKSGVGEEKKEGIGEKGVEMKIIDEIEKDGNIREGGVKLLDMRDLENEIVMNNKKRIDRLMKESWEKRMEGERFGGGDWREEVEREENMEDRLDLRGVERRSRCWVRIDVIDIRSEGRKRNFNEEDWELERRWKNVVEVGGWEIEKDLEVDIRKEWKWSLEVLKKKKEWEERDEEEVEVIVIGEWRGGRSVVIFGRNGENGVEKKRKCKVEVLEEEGKNKVMIEIMDNIIGIEDEMIRCREGRRNRIVDEIDIEEGRKCWRRCRDNGFWKGEWEEEIWEFLEGDIGGIENGEGGREEGKNDDEGKIVGELIIGKKRIWNRMINGDMIKWSEKKVEENGEEV